ncbi:MAG: cysteine desulfurase [Turicibacter sp.]|nr:cysteine desulfurase [Turicibacter sp.]
MIYLDNSATTPVDPEVLAAFVKVNENFWGNPSSLHTIGAQAESLLMQSERQVLTLLNASNHRVVFTSGATESNNLALKGFCRACRGRGRHIITTPVEHPSVHEVLEGLMEEGYRITFIDIIQSDEGMLNEIEAAICDDTVLVSIMHVNNETGRVFPVYKIGEMLKKYPKVRYHVDAVQSVGKLNVDMDRLGAQMLSMSAHKIHGIKGCGLLLVNENLQLKAEITGGGQMNGLRSGTINVPGAVALAKALRLVVEPLNENYKKIAKIFDYTLSELLKIEGVVINSTGHIQSPYIINFAAVPIKGETLVHALEEHEVYISAKSACSSKSAAASRILLAMGISEEVAFESVRVSFSSLTTLEDAEAFIEALKTVLPELKSRE